MIAAQVALLAIEAIEAIEAVEAIEVIDVSARGESLQDRVHDGRDLRQRGDRAHVLPGVVEHRAV